MHPLALTFINALKLCSNCLQDKYISLDFHCQTLLSAD